MSLPRPTGLKAPSKINRPSTGVPRPSGIPAPGSRAQSPEASSQASSTDDLKIGDRVWVSGTKPGVIAFIGEAQFAPGEWAGVALDDPIGKNDGSVAGVRYFQCEPMKGVFSRLSKLSRTPGGPGVETQKGTDASSETHSNSKSQSSAHNGTANHTPARSQTPRIGLSASKSKSGSNVSLNKDSSPASSTSLHRGGLAMTKHGVKIGDRVIVSGTKSGILRYVGQTDFAKGEWAGVELDEPQGKNDGAVAGKRYFDCRPNFGLFAPIHKVARFTGGATPSPQSRSLANTSLRSARERSGSQESISSVSSTASSVSRSRVRLGVTSLASQASKSGQRPSTLNLSATTSALQKALKEKEEHIEQLLRERDLERAEVARAAAKVDEAEGALVSERHDKDMIMADTEEQLRQLREIILELEKEKKGLAVKLEEEKRKVEDLQFQIEEEVISKDDLECRTEEDEEKLRSLERNYKKEKDRADKMEQELQALKDMVTQQQKKLKEADDTQTTYLDQMEELTYKLNQAENKIKTFEANRLEEGAKTSQVSMDLEEKTNRVTELEEALSAQKKEIKQLQDKLVEVKEELTDTNSKKQKMQDTITDLQRQLATSKDKVEELTDDRNRLEAQLSDLMKNSGDSSKQLSLLNEQVAEKTRKIEDLQSDLSSSTQKVAILSETIEQLKLEKEKEREDIVNRSKEEVKAAEAKLEDVQTELDRTKAKVQKLIDASEQEKVEIQGKNEGEVAELKKQLATSAEELEKERLQTQAHKQVLDQITLERETMKFEKEKAEKNLKRVESERDGVNTELVQTRVELSKLQAESQQSSTLKQNMEEQIQIAQEDKERALKAKKELQKQYEDSQAEKDKIVSEKNQLQQDAMATKADIQKKDIQIEELHKEIEKLKSETNYIQKELMEKSQSESDNSELSQNLEATKQQLTSVQSNLKEVEAEKLKLTAEVEQLQLVKEERKKLENQNKYLQSEMEGATKSEEKASLEASKAALQSKVDNSSKELSQKQKNMEEYIKKIGDLESENLALSSFKTTALSKEKELTTEKNQLLDKVHSLEAMVKESKKNANNISAASGDPESARFKAEKDTADKQVEFLNSVIVELQRKNEDLQIRLQAMESGVYDNGDAVEGMDISPSRSRAAPRLFCDICEVFDLHDTDDCPKQAMSDSPPATHYHGDRKQTRPYCDICESDVRHVEGMSDPETLESPRATSFPAVIVDDIDALKNRREYGKSKKPTTRPFRSEEIKGKTSNHKGNKPQTTRTSASTRQTTKKSGGGATTSDNMYVTSSTHAKMKSKLAEELGCEPCDIGDIRPRTLYRLGLVLSNESTDEDPIDLWRLQQAILKADQAIQQQSKMFEGQFHLTEDHDLVSKVKSSKAKKSQSRSDYRKQENTVDQSFYSVGTPSVGTPAVETPSVGTPSVGTPSVGTPAVETPSVGTPSVCSGTSELEEFIDGLHDLDYPDWYNEKCDAEVASLDLGHRGEPESKEKDKNIEDEELKIFEELEAKLAEDSLSDDADIICKTESKVVECEQKTATHEEANATPINLERQTEEDKSERRNLAVKESVKGDVTSDDNVRPIPDPDVDEKTEVVNVMPGQYTDSGHQDQPEVDASEETDRVLNASTTREEFEKKPILTAVDDSSLHGNSLEIVNIREERDTGKDDSDHMDDQERVMAEASNINTPELIENIQEDESVIHEKEFLQNETSVSKLEISENQDESHRNVLEADNKESDLCEDEAAVVGPDAVEWTRRDSYTMSTSAESEQVSASVDKEYQPTDEPGTLEVDQSNTLSCDEFETPPSGTSPSVTPHTSTSPCLTPPDNTSPCLTPPDNTSPCLTPPDNTSPCLTPPDNTSPCLTPPDNTSPCLKPPDNTSPCLTPPDNTSSCLTPPDNTSPCLTPPDNMSPCLAPADNTSPCLTPPDNTSPCLTPPDNTSPSFAPPCVTSENSTPPFGTPPDGPSPCVTPPCVKPSNHASPNATSTSDTTPDYASPCLTPDCVASSSVTSPTDTPPNSTSPCVTPPCVTPPSNVSPSVTPPRSATPTPLPSQDNLTPLDSVSDESVTRRSKKGRCSPTKRSSVPASTCTDLPQPDVKSKTESCVIS